MTDQPPPPTGHRRLKLLFVGLTMIAVSFSLSMFIMRYAPL